MPRLLPCVIPHEMHKNEHVDAAAILFMFSPANGGDTLQIVAICNQVDSKNTFRTYSLNETASKFHLWHSDLEAKKCWWTAGMAEPIITHHTDPGLSRIWKKALWLLLSERQRGYPNTCVHNADHLRMGEVPHNVAVWNQAEERLLTCTLWESTEPSMYVVFCFLTKNH